MQAFLGKASIKRKYLTRVRAHRKADQLVHGVYWAHGKGCAVGCTVHSDKHAAYETELGIPRVLARLEDGLFESLPNGKAMEWPERFLSAIKPKADLSLVWPRFAVWLLVDPKYGVLQFAKSERSKKAIQDVANAYQGLVDGKTETVDWQQLRYAAYAAASASAVTNAAAISASYAAYAAAYASAVTNAAAISASDASAYASNQRDDEWRIAQADKLIDLLRACKPKEKL